MKVTFTFSQYASLSGIAKEDYLHATLIGPLTIEAEAKCKNLSSAQMLSMMREYKVSLPTLLPSAIVRSQMVEMKQFAA